MNERWHMFRFTCKNPWVRQPQNEALSSLAEFRWRGEISGVKRKIPHQDAFFTPTGRHQPRHSPFQTHRDVSASYRFLSLTMLLSHHFTFYYCSSSLFPLQCILLCLATNRSTIQYWETVTFTHRYIHITEFTCYLHTTAIYSVEFDRC